MKETLAVQINAAIDSPLTVRERAKKWRASKDVGNSSIVIYDLFMGIVEPKRMRTFPNTYDAFSKCIILLKMVPEWRPRLEEVAAVYPRWKIFVENWKTLEKLYSKGNDPESVKKVEAKLLYCWKRCGVIRRF